MKRAAKERRAGPGGRRCSWGRPHAGRAAGVLLATALAWGGGRPPAAGADRVSKAIDRGIEFLVKEAQTSRTVHWNEPYRMVGQVALETYALVVAGVSVNHPVIRGSFSWLKSELARMDFTYTLACYVFALDAAIAQLEQDILVLNPERVRQGDIPAVGREYRGELAGAVTRLVRLEKPNGGWNYHAGDGERYDTSNSQFAVLALGAGAKRGARVSGDVWFRVVEHFVKGQDREGEIVKERLTMMEDDERWQRKHQVTVRVEGEGGRAGPRARGGGSGESEAPAGKRAGGTGSRTQVGSPENPEVGTEDVPVHAWGWGYQFPKNRICWNMTCAGLSSLLLARENLRGKIPQSTQESLNLAVRNGYGWLLAHWNPDGREHGYYGLYSLEKVADIGGVKKFGAHDWYAGISEQLVKAQQGDGSWAGTGKHAENTRVTTAFALLVLNRATEIVLASRNPVERIMVSGRRSTLGDVDDRSWVYVPLLDTTIHYPTLLRTIRLRPHPKLVKFFRNVVDHYPDEWKGELVPEMARAWRDVENRAVRGILEEYLAQITGYRYQELEKYDVWYRRWERVKRIGAERQRSEIPLLLKYYKHTNRSVPLKKTIAWALLQCKASEAIPLFLEALEHEDPAIRENAYRSFRGFFIEYPPPFDPTAPAAARGEQVAAIRSWYAGRAAASR